MSTVPAASMIGMVYSLVISAGLPILLLVLLKIKTKASFSSFVFGAATFMVFALILEQILHTVVLGTAGDYLTTHIWAYALYGGAAAAVFEETGRLIVMKTLMKNKLDRDDALMFGVGHGGIEAIIVAGMGAISNLVMSVMINTGAGEQLLASAGEEAMNKVSQLWTLPSYMFYMSGIERIAAIFLQIAMAYLVYMAVRYKKMRYYGLALAVHFLVDALTVFLSQQLQINVILLEVFVFIYTGLVILFVRHLALKEEKLATEDTVPATEA